MKKRETISILDFIRTGKFGTVELEQTEENVRRIFPKPDSIYPVDQYTAIWTYGAFEFHFIDKSITLLWCDNLDFMYKPKKKQFN